MDRIARFLEGGELKAAFAFLLSMPGAPFIYYGDEIGMRYVEGLTSVEGGYGRTGSRSPMQWDETENAGFSRASAEKLYIPLDPDENRPTLSRARADENSLYHEIRRLIGLRRAHKALGNRGEIEFLTTEKNQYPLAYLRSLEDEKILAVINPSDREQQFDSPLLPGKELYRFGEAVTADGTKITVPASSYGFYFLQ